MWKLRYYGPLIAFIVPSAAIGYGIVLPRSGATGWNSLTLGFASTLIAASAAYIIGIASALRTSCPRARPWRIRINNYINRQASNPHGAFGRFLGFMWKRDHRDINRVTLDLLNAARGAHLLEIGCGPGETLREIAQRGCSVVGLDVSETMISIAQQRNRKAVHDGCVEVRHVEDGKFDLEGAAFDHAFSVHCVYFWRSPRDTLSAIAAALKPRGRLVLAFMPDSPQVPARFRDDTYRFYEPSEMVSLLTDVGFADIRTIRRPDISKKVVWVIAARTP